MKLLRFLLQLLVRRVRGLSSLWMLYRRFGVFAGQGSILSKLECMHIGQNFTLGRDCRLYCQDPENGTELFIGDDVALNDGVVLNADCGGKLNIGNKVIVGPNTIIRAANHGFDNINIPIREQEHQAGKIVLEDDVWLGAAVVVLPDVTIGQGSVIGAGSVVTRDIPPYSVAVGVPARVIGKRDGRKLSEQEIST